MHKRSIKGLCEQAHMCTSAGHKQHAPGLKQKEKQRGRKKNKGMYMWTVNVTVLNQTNHIKCSLHVNGNIREVEDIQLYLLFIPVTMINFSADDNLYAFI